MQLDYTFEQDQPYSRIKFFTQKIVDDVNKHFNTNYVVQTVYNVSNEMFVTIHDYIITTKSYSGVWC